MYTEYFKSESGSSNIGVLGGSAGSKDQANIAELSLHRTSGERIQKTGVPGIWGLGDLGSVSSRFELKHPVKTRFVLENGS